jgi:hypothetical protein
VNLYIKYVILKLHKGEFYMRRPWKFLEASQSAQLLYNFASSVEVEEYIVDDFNM